MKNAGKTKRNNIFQNAFIVYKAMFKRYPTAIPLVIVYIIISVALPFINTLIPAMAIKGITSGYTLEKEIPSPPPSRQQRSGGEGAG